MGRIFLWCGSKTQKLLTSLAKNKAMRVLQPQSKQIACRLGTNPPPQKDAFEGSAHQTVLFTLGWTGLTLASTHTGSLSWRARLYRYNTCVGVIHSCLQLRLIRYKWGASFFDVGANLKNYSCRLQRTKPCGSFGLRADKLLAGLEQILSHKYLKCLNFSFHLRPSNTLSYPWLDPSLTPITIICYYILNLKKKTLITL